MQLLIDEIQKSSQAILQLQEPSSLSFLQRAADLLSSCFATGHKVLVAGNGGSLCQATHFCEEMTGQFRDPRPPLPAIALADSGHITCTANDYGFTHIFSRGIEAYGKRNDIFLGLSTSGNSDNVYNAFMKAIELGLKTIALLGNEGGRCRGVADVELVIHGFPTSDRIQEAHMTALHLLVELVENTLFPIKPSHFSLSQREKEKRTTPIG